ncbi:MAG: NADH-quinone oxidoreductase subunit L [Candidatus Krumholzibacteria bacterium]|jgi:NADH-quinone oxidoreductase subunit L|nr:NADH-quinone oxidoreductase subunit L [Candidatus Krumholzibacteria bacterium]MDP6797536.1 NADH-quinone oxidoreductase subunit L [Candidatus Krumholzibacteria bacterium]MDP7021383.1 NADH-quinone oxidoreductase subunit L [Candidatus Krumholzibacteria bacterium]
MEHSWIGWIIFLPLLGFVFNIFLGKKVSNTLSHLVGVGAVFGSFLLSLTAFRLLRMPGSEDSLTQELWTWIRVGSGTLPTLDLSVALTVDHLSAVMLLVVTGVGTLIHVYSIGYMKGDPGYGRFFSYLNLFSFSMLLLVLADNMLLMFVGWEGVGLCSYLLIGFWFKHLPNTTAGNKAFIVNRIGDFAFVIGLMLLFWGLHRAGHASLRFSDINLYASSLAGDRVLGLPLLDAIGIFFFIGATGKSAQIPLFVWLPDAMAGPTPVSALIHAATMVTAGVYMIGRLNGLYSLAPIALATVATVGALTAVFSASIGLVQNDIKKVLAYSTVSQLGYMMLAMGVAAYSAGIFHLVTHAFFKACLFLGSGSVILAMHHEQDIRKMGGLAKKMPWTYGTFLVSTIAIAGIPPFSGFFSKDEILWKTWESGHHFLWFLGMLGALMTAFYMFRLVALTFFGENRADEHTREHLKEQPAVVVGPLVVLAFLAAIAGFWGVPHALGGSNQFQQWLEPVMSSPHASWQAPSLTPPALASETEHVQLHRHEEDESPAEVHEESYGHEEHSEESHGEHHAVDPMEYVLMAISVLLAALSGGAALWIYTKRPDLPGKWAEKYSKLYQLLLGKYFIDEIYDAAIVKNLFRLMYRLARFDLLVIDGIVNGAAHVTRWTAIFSGWFDNTFVDGMVNGTASTARWAGSHLRKLQTGRIQSYVYAVATGVVILAVLGLIVGFPR